MNFEKEGLFSVIKDYVANNLTERDLSKAKPIKMRSFLKKDAEGIYSIFDNNRSIKCVFNDRALKDYLAGLPSYIKYESFDSKKLFYFRS